MPVKDDLVVNAHTIHQLPELLTMVSRTEVGELFDIFFEHSKSYLTSRKQDAHSMAVAPHVPLIYREFHTPDLVLQRSQFLCTV